MKPIIKMMAFPHSDKLFTNPDAEAEEAMPVYGCYTFMSNANKDLFHTPVPISNLSATFSPKMYFWPIKHSELKRNKQLTQNPGWTYND